MLFLSSRWELIDLATYLEKLLSLFIQMSHILINITHFDRLYVCDD